MRRASAPLAGSGVVSGIVEIQLADQVVVVHADTPLPALQTELRELGVCLPYGESTPFANRALGVLLGEDLPHTLQAQCGSWRDWVLGITATLADGTKVKLGSRAVKNVAGYDLTRLAVGSRGTLLTPVEVVLRLFPVGALPPEAVQHGLAEEPRIVHLVLPADFGAALAATEGMVLADREGSTLWSVEGPSRRFERDALWRFGEPPEVNDTTRRFMVRAKELFDPERKLNPGAFGFL